MFGPPLEGVAWQIDCGFPGLNRDGSRTHFVEAGLRLFRKPWPRSARRLQTLDHPGVLAAARVDERGDRCRDDILARREQATDIVERTHRVHLTLRHVKHAAAAILIILS